MDLKYLEKEAKKLKGIYSKNDIYKIILDSRGRKYVEAK